MQKNIVETAGDAGTFTTLVAARTGGASPAKERHR